jgi:outer membrane protein assembly factor BamB
VRKGRFYFFPAFLPLIEILPWLLTAVGALAGSTQFFRKNKKKSVILGVALLCFLTAAGIIGWQYWRNPTAEQGSQMTAQNALPRLETLKPPPPVTGVDNGEAFTLVWSQKTATESLATPVRAGNYLLFGDFKGHVEARETAGGNVIWRLYKSQPIFTAVTVTADRAYIGEGLHTAITSALTAVSLPDGKPLWQREFLGHLEAPPAVRAATHQLWESAGPQGVWALDTETGAVLWRAKIGHTDSTPLLLNDFLYVSAQPDDAVKETLLYQMNPDTGKTLWSVKLQGASMGSPLPAAGGSPLIAAGGSPLIAAGDSVIYLMTAIGQVGPQQASDRGWSHAVTTAGKILWSVPLPNMALPESAIDSKNGLVIHTLKSGAVIALHMQDGSTAWKVKLADKIYAAATLISETAIPYVAVIAVDGMVHILRASDGTEVLQFKLEQGGYVSPLYSQDMFYLTTPKNIFAYRGLAEILK